MTANPERWQRVKAVLDDVLQHEPAAWPSLVARACGGDVELQREVEALLASHQSAGTFLETPYAALLSAPSDDLSGREVGPYIVQSRIGAGGMGEVYLAYDRKLDRPVALKLLSSSLAADRERLRRFHQEARAASSLNHPHILVIHDFGDHEGRPFMVTEFIEGRTLRQMLQAGAIPVAQAVGIAIQAASALAAAHARGIVHRDIKPENVMVRPDGYVKVLDFGLAKLAVPAQAEADGLAVRTQPGMLMGTPRYMSPEQARGLELDARTDVWSLGVVLYEMLSGRAPFAGATSADLIAAVLGSEPTPLELQAPAVPAALGRIVGRALIKHRPDRYETVAQMRAELDVVLKGLDLAEPAPPITGAGPPWPLSAESTPVAGRRTPTRLIVLPFRILRADPETDFLAFSLADAISTALSSLDSLVVRSTMSATRFTSDTLDPQAIADQMQVDAVVAGTLLRAGMQLRASAQLLSIPQGTILWSDRMDVSMADIFRLQDELTERIVDALAVPLTAREQETLRRDVPASAEAYELYLRGNTHFYHFDDWTIARDLYLECVKRDAGFAPAWARLGRCFRLSAKFKSASVVEMTDNLRRADVAFRKAFELNPDLPLAHHLFTALETDLGRAEDAMMRLVRRAQQRRNDPEIYAGLVHACSIAGCSRRRSPRTRERARWTR